ncbi:MAG: (2Fe-2S)-binding protein [Planctomycetes bacterium]|nr:(2Fe-2S)-binding protein [Planctomycetota bacterium]
MTKIIIDGKTIECRDHIPVLQAALESGWDVPHYCYHPGLQIVASCRLCLMEMKMPNPKTKEMDWAPKLFPSCQTPVKDGIEVRFASDKVKENQQECMEYFLLNHPLDCPVCDQAGECHLQDYSLRFGEASSRMVEAKNKNPKKDIGSKTLLYQDRCVMCTRCVRFTNEISGTGELAVIQRGSKAEIDIFPGIPLENELQGNVVDICPVGSLLDKDFLMKAARLVFKRHQEHLPAAPPVAPSMWITTTAKSGGSSPASTRRQRLGMCDEGRFGWKYVHDPKRLNRLTVRRGAESEYPQWAALDEIVRLRLTGSVKENGAEKVAVMLSPFMSCEEAWLLAKFIREIATDALLAIGPIPVGGEDKKFPMGDGKPVKFTINAEKCPNKRGIEMVLSAMGGRTCAFDDFVKKAAAGEFAAAWIVGGYPGEWVTKELASAAAKINMLIAQDILPNAVTESAKVVIPSCSWAERSGTFVNGQGKIQPFEAAINPIEGCQRDGQYLSALNGASGLFNAESVRSLMVEKMPLFAQLHVPPEMPAHAH